MKSFRVAVKSAFLFIGIIRHLDARSPVASLPSRPCGNRSRDGGHRPHGLYTGGEWARAQGRKVPTYNVILLKYMFKNTLGKEVVLHFIDLAPESKFYTYFYICKIVKLWIVCIQKYMQNWVPFYLEGSSINFPISII